MLRQIFVFVVVAAVALYYNIILVCYVEPVGAKTKINVFKCVHSFC